MVISIASGKGGTGKTTVAVNLAIFLADKGYPVQYLDCDVEEPNGCLFLKPQIEERREVTVPVPQVDLEICSFCGRCSEVCAFNAVAVVNKNVLVFEELCHGCGGCMLFCPEKAIVEKERVLGILETGSAGTIRFAQGVLNVGEPKPTPVVGRVKDEIRPSWINIVDVSPGTSCPVMEGVKGSDFVVLATEPTPFGLHDLVLADQMTREMSIPRGVLINRSDIGDDEVKLYCRKEGIPLVGEIPFDKAIAVLYSRGTPMVRAESRYRKIFQEIWCGIEGNLPSGVISCRDGSAQSAECRGNRRRSPRDETDCHH